MPSRCLKALSPKQRRRRRKAIFKDFRSIWEARHYQTALRRDLRSTVTYYSREQQFPTWGCEHLRTTSRLERSNRRLRRRARAANAYHSDDGVLAMIAQEAYESNTPQRAL